MSTSEPSCGCPAASPRTTASSLPLAASTCRWEIAGAGAGRWVCQLINCCSAPAWHCRPAADGLEPMVQPQGQPWPSLAPCLAWATNFPMA